MNKTLDKIIDKATYIAVYINYNKRKVITILIGIIFFIVLFFVMKYTHGWSNIFVSLEKWMHS